MTDGHLPGFEPDPTDPVATPGRRRLVVGLVVVLVAAGAVGIVATRDGSCPPGGAAFAFEGEAVTEDEVARRAEVVEALYGLIPPTDDRLDSYRRELAKSMATALIIEDGAAARDIVVAERAVRDALDRYISEFFPDTGRDGFVSAMGNKGVSEAEVLAEFRQIQTTFRLLDAVTSDVAVTDAEVEAAFEERRDELALPEQRRIRHLVVATEADADAALGRVQRGEALAAVAMTVSLDTSTRDQGGDLGLLSAATLEEPFRRAAFSAPQGALFGPVMTTRGWHLGVVEEISPARAVTLDEAREPLRQQLLTEGKLSTQRAFVAGALEKADVCYADEFLPADPTAPPPATPTTTPTATPTTKP